MMYFKGWLNWVLMALMVFGVVFHKDGMYSCSFFLLVLRSNLVWWPLRLFYGHPGTAHYRRPQDVPIHRNW